MYDGTTNDGGDIMLKTTVNGRTYVWSRSSKLWTSDNGDTLTLAAMDKLKWR